MSKQHKQPRRMVVIDDHRVGDIVERTDGGFDAFDINKNYLGSFETATAASRAIPRLVDAQRAQEKRTRRAGRGRS